MRLLALFSVLLACLVPHVLTTDNGLTKLVEWDKYSLTINGKRTFILAAEFHYQRLPVPELWLDVFQKFKAEGFNAISIYFFWSFHSPSEGVYDFETGARNLQKLFDYAQEAGLWVITRAGPYCNAETNAGGLALYLSDGSGGRLRTSDEMYYKAWLPWIEKVGAIIADNQITEGGPVILNQHENELQETVYDPEDTVVKYMKQVKAAFLGSGIKVPSSHNEKGQRSISWSTDYKDVGGSVNIYGLDSYPGGLSCTNPDTGFNVVRSYYQWFQNYSYTQPEFIPEFEGGWFAPWGGTFYDQCSTELNPEFADVYYKNNIGQRITLLSIYMAFGGTNWGHSAAPVVFTSYDYSAPLRETREVRNKLKQTKLLGLFTRVSKDIFQTRMEGNGAGYAVTDNSIWSWVLRNPDTGAGFYTVQHNNTKSRESTTFTVKAKTSQGEISIPDITLDGRQSKIVVTDYSFGNLTLLYSSAEVLSYASLDKEVIVLYMNEGQVGYFSFKDSPATYTTYGADANFSSTTFNGTKRYGYQQTSSTTVVQFSNNALVFFLEKEAAWNFYAPSTVDSPAVAANEQIYVFGPHLVRTARVSGTSVFVTGDSNNGTDLEIYVGDAQVDTIQWNSKKLITSRTPYGSLKASLSEPSASLTLPLLDNWHTADSLPEIEPSYDDTSWPICNKTTTLSPFAPVTLPVLFASDYGFYTGAKVYRLYFATANASTVNLTASNGLAAGWSAWLNGKFLYSYPGNTSESINSQLIQLPHALLLNSTNSTLNNGSGNAENVLTVLVSYTGHDQASTAQGVNNPRGLLGASLKGSKFTSIRIRGAAPPGLDTVRGPMNEGGLYGERLGWHLPGFPSSKWALGSPSAGTKQAGVQWYSTTAELQVPDGFDIPMGVELSSPAGTTARVGLWVNGYLMGKYVPHIGPQTRFPVPPGVLNTRGTNWISVAIWAQGESGAKVDVKMIEYGRYESGFELGFRGDEGLRPEYEGGREQYR